MSWNNGGYPRSRGDDSMALLNIMLLGSLIEQAGGANGAPVETRIEPTGNPAETQRVSSTPGNGGLAGKTGEFNPPEYGGVALREGCAICTPVDVTHGHAASRSDSVRSRDAAVTVAQGRCNWCRLPETVLPSQRQSHAESLPRSLPKTPTQESAPMIVNLSAMPSDSGPTAAQVQALSGALDAAGKLHTQAFGSNTIRGLIEELGKCQQALAGFLPVTVENFPHLAAGEHPENFPDPDQGGKNSTSVEGKENFPEGGQSAPRTGSGAVHALVSSALQAHDAHIEMLQAESVHLRVQIEQWTARRRELLDFLQTGVARA